MSWSLLLQQWTACLVRLTWIVFLVGGRWPSSCCFVRCCLHDLFNIACSILVKLPSSFFSIRLISIHVVHPYSSIDTNVAWKNQNKKTTIGNIVLAFFFNYLLYIFYLHWALDRNYLILTFYIWISKLSSLELFSTLDWLYIYIYIYIYICWRAMILTKYTNT